MSGMDWEGANRREGARAVPAPAPTVAWWWVPGRGRCDECGEPVGDVAAYNHTLKRGLCQICVEREGIVAAPSKRLLAVRARAGR